jgi:hypothetical protein
MTSSSYKSDQEKIRRCIDDLYSHLGDKLYLALKSPEEVTALKKKSLTVLKSHNYMSPENRSTEHSYHGVAEKIRINGRHVER